MAGLSAPAAEPRVYGGCYNLFGFGPVRRRSGPRLLRLFRFLGLHPCLDLFRFRVDPGHALGALGGDEVGPAGAAADAAFRFRLFDDLGETAGEAAAADRRTALRA